ncbi:hypothetical protein IMG5_116370 [Ichthyophthirius multifiliis]|uniref:Integral membrane protein n=1 Tax=Ichthyophthirius multifiliis TaxID=5932 RepID=G0QUC9_ICHMU|nr:hypothetical protein IMG5_116370 [Ichthyophthirius multifiliis]EGR31166.1 hypothetical protein IMG5_116370 [Ichthyophthirius multifiliis]|eukprot:XP_004034652.1 hypothetical protein IMG5_116370 [Ichthyophthirius multifiliis]
MQVRNLQQARQAYEKKDLDFSKNAHSKQSIIPQEDHNESGIFIKSAVYGGLDGMITTYSVVMGVAGANLQSGVILALGIANLIGDGLSMALGDYLSSKSECDFYKKERMREEWEVDNNPEGEKEEMIEVYQKKGITYADSKALVDILSKYKKVWIDTMMVDELGILPNDENPIYNAIVTFVSFVIFGSVPLLPFIFGFAFEIQGWAFLISTILTSNFLCILGIVKSMFTYQSWFKSGLETLFVGITAASASYFIGSAFETK